MTTARVVRALDLPLSSLRPQVEQVYPLRHRGQRHGHGERGQQSAEHAVTEAVKPKPRRPLPQRGLSWGACSPCHPTARRPAHPVLMPHRVHLSLRGHRLPIWGTPWTSMRSSTGPATASP